MVHRQTSEEIAEQAMEWIVRADFHPLDEADQVALANWLEADDRHLGAYMRAAAIFRHSQRSRAPGPDFDPGAWGVISLAEEEAHVADRPPGVARRRMLALSAGAAVATAASFLFGKSETAQARTFATDRGETRLIPLSEGVTVTLNTASRIEVLAGAKWSFVTLHDGEAFFEAAGMPGYNLRVLAGVARLDCGKAAFNVNLQTSTAEIVVNAGRIGLRKGANAPLLAVLNAGQLVRVGKGRTMHIGRLSDIEMERHESWREGILTFQDTPLSEAVAEYSRYSKVRIELDPSIASQTVTGRFSSASPLTFAQSVAQALELRIEPVDGGVAIRANGGS